MRSEHRTVRYLRERDEMGAPDASCLLYLILYQSVHCCQLAMLRARVATLLAAKSKQQQCPIHKIYTIHASIGLLLLCM